MPDHAPTAAPRDAASSVAKWSDVAASELSTAQSFALDLCRLLGVEAPHPDAEQQYMFERPVVFAHGDGSTSPGRIDLYKRGCFVRALSIDDIAARFSARGPWKKRLPQLLDMLVALGRARERAGRYTGA